MESPRREADNPAITIWIEGDATVDPVAILASALPSLAAEVLVAVVAGGVARIVAAARVETTSLDEWPSRPLRRLNDVRALLEETPGSDVLIVESRRVLTDEVVRELAAAAYVDSVCASVSVSEPLGAAGLPERPHARGSIPPPAVASPIWGLVYLRRDAVELALDHASAVTRGSTESRSVRELLAGALSQPGLVHRRVSHPELVPTSPRPRKARSADQPISVIVDMRHLADAVTGTQVQAVALLGALSVRPELELTAIAPARFHPSVIPLVERLQDVRFSDVSSVTRADIFHRPHQIVVRNDLFECMILGRRFVLTHQDMIAERTPSYFPSLEAWSDFRRTTNMAFDCADQVAFFSEHSAVDAASDGVLDIERATVVPLGVDHIRSDSEFDRPASLSALAGRPFILVMGTAFRHKNRLFALRLVRELVERSWEGGLVLAGMDPPNGSSVPDERLMLGEDPRLRDRVLTVGHVSESQKRALYREAALTLFPSLHEGFGLVPFESAALGTPCLYAWRSSVPEFLPRAGALPADFSVERSASAVLDLLGSRTSQEALVSRIRARAATLTWDETARGYVDVYRGALAQPPKLLDRSSVAAFSTRTSAQERAILQVYRRRPAFQALVNAIIRVGAVVMRATKRGRPEP